MATSFDQEAFKRQLARAEKYLLARRAKFLGEQLKKVASVSAIRNWLEDLDSESKGYSKPTFTAEMRNVPDFEIIDRVFLYQNILSNSGLDGDSQKSIKDYEGRYRLVFPKELAKEEKCIKWIFLKAFTRPYFFGFTLRYAQPPTPRTLGSICDGMVFRRGGRFYMLGTAHETNLMAHFKAEHYPKQNPMFGQMTLEVIPNRIFINTKFALVWCEDDNYAEMLKDARSTLG